MPATPTKLPMHAVMPLAAALATGWMPRLCCTLGSQDAGFIFTLCFIAVAQVPSRITALTLRRFIGRAHDALPLLGGFATPRRPEQHGRLLLIGLIEPVVFRRFSSRLARLLLGFRWLRGLKSFALPVTSVAPHDLPLYVGPLTIFMSIWGYRLPTTSCSLAQPHRLHYRALTR